MNKIEPETIVLGDKSWTVQPLTLGQLEELQPIVAEGVPEAGGSVGYALRIVELGLRHDHPDDAKALREVRATSRDLQVASVAVLRLGGYLTGGDSALGEAVAAKAASPTSDGSTDASAPPRDGASITSAA